MIYSLGVIYYVYADVAQSVAHRIGSAKVMGSIPVVSRASNPKFLGIGAFLSIKNMGGDK